MKALINLGKKITPALFFTVSVAILATVLIFGCSKLKDNHSKNPDNYYMTKDELETAGITIVELTNDQKNILHDIIRNYYATDYIENLEKRYREQMDPAGNQEKNEYYEQKIKDLQYLKIGEITFSEPRAYDGLDDILGIVAHAKITSASSSKRGVGDKAFLFLFQTNNNNLVLKKAISMINWRKEEIFQINKIRYKIEK